MESQLKTYSAVEQELLLNFRLKDHQNFTSSKIRFFKFLITQKIMCEWVTSAMQSTIIKRKQFSPCLKTSRFFEKIYQHIDMTNLLTKRYLKTEKFSIGITHYFPTVQET
ncbi:CLUMA_CG020132, isoform A [Clunio marinus]|uniref:CLUMA_CG020132, isoform A n=1 Tax=Clunio marinus TaxID=568069 RepID=A0A1J1J899_9DIPT|nr:CLUMA_CG020132, isoform A [Clunio marinus]